ncbi:MAG: hypothetical protein WCG02_02990 [Candidatus Taylorbacteria bacterium]
MMKSIFRILIDIAIFICLVHAWWYFALLLAIIGLWNFGLYIEIILAGLIYDALYGTMKVTDIMGSIGLVVGVIFFVILTFIKKLVRIRE